MKSDNDYIAEYIKEFRPEVTESLHYLLWVTKRKITDALSAFFESIHSNPEIQKSLARLADDAEEESERKLKGNDCSQSFIDEFMAAEERGGEE